MDALPPFEQARLLELERLRLLDRPSDQDIEDILELGRVITGSDLCAVNLITEFDQIEKFSSGNKLGNIKRDDSFCQHVVNDNKPLFVKDAQEDDRFRHNKNVKAKSGIRAYAGIPIHGANNLPLGALCIISGKPREFGEDEEKILKLVSRILHRRLIPETSAEPTDALPEMISSGDDFMNRFNTILCDGRRKPKTRTALFYFQDSTVLESNGQEDLRTVYEVRRMMIDRLASIASKNQPEIEGGTLGTGQYALALNTSVSDAGLKKLAKHILASLRKPIPTKSGQMSPDLKVSVFIDNETIHDPHEVLSLCQFVQGYTHMSTPNVIVLSPKRVKQALRLGVGRTRISDAIKNKKITLVFQPVVDAKDHSTSGFEALIRWKDPELGTFSALEILELAEIEGQNLNLDYAVLEMALACAAQREVATHEKSRIAINIDVRSLVSPNFVRRAKKIIALSKLDPKLIEIELTEHSIIDDPETVIQKMNHLIDIGVSFVLDDFGTGFSSLTHLHKLPVKKLKIDKSFVSKIGDEKSATLVQSMISTARLLGMETTGEGAETNEHMIVLNALGCTHVQGYYISRPLSLKNYLKPFTPREREDVA